jgi:WhiB family transcriptional regulator, redox-sensing transcriptional regulator
VALRRDEERVQGGLVWQRQAKCKGALAEAFYPPVRIESKDERDYREARAKKICASCPVAEQCLAHALANRETHGIWGGLNEVERRALIAEGRNNGHA